MFTVLQLVTYLMSPITEPGLPPPQKKKKKHTAITFIGPAYLVPWSPYLDAIFPIHYDPRPQTLQDCGLRAVWKYTSEGPGPLILM